MKITFTELKNFDSSSFSDKQKKTIEQLKRLLQLLTEREIPEEVVAQINQEIEQLNSFQGSAKNTFVQIRRSYLKILRIIEKELKLVPKNHYRNTWMILGMSIFGVPMGVALSVPSGNFGLLGAGLPIGMGIGIAVGTAMDKKAEQNNRQLDL